MSLSWQWSEEYFQMAREQEIFKLSFLYPTIPPYPRNWIEYLNCVTLHCIVRSFITWHCTAWHCRIWWWYQSLLVHTLSPPPPLTHLHTYTHMYTRTYRYIQLYTHIYTYTHIHAHMTYHVWGIELRGIYDSLLRDLIKIKLDSNPKPPAT